MTILGWVQIALYALVIILITKPFGWYMTRVFNGERVPLYWPLRPIERALYWVSGVNEKQEQSWLTYAVSMLFFSVAGFVTLYALQRFQASLPFNPQGQAAVTPDLAFNTSVSFVTNTNWQSYTPETTMSYLVQMAGLTVHNFLSAATGIALALALIRGFSRRNSNTVGNFWVDMTRCTLYVLLPVSIVVGLFFVWQGMPQNLSPYTEVATLEGGKQLIAQGPVASQEVIKMLGTNGGGFFNANSAHPFENPNAITNFIQIVLIFSIGAALTNVFGRMVGDQRQGWAIFSVMGLLFLAGVAVCYSAEGAGNPAFANLGIDTAPSALQPGGNMEGKELRFGIANSALFTTITTDASCGAVNNMHDSLTPLGGMIPMINIMLGEIIFGGVGSGLYGMLLFAILAVFIAGLMVGRTPEYLGKKIEAKEVKMAMLAILILPLLNPGLLGHRRRRQGWPRRNGERRPARLQRGAIRLHLRHRQQRQRVCGALRQYDVLQHDARLRDADRPLPDGHPGARHSRIARAQADPAAIRGNLPDPRLAVRPARLRRDPHSWRSHILSRALARPGRRTFRDDRRSNLLSFEVKSMLAPATTAKSRRTPTATITDPKILIPAIGESFKKLNPVTLAKNPVMFVVEVVALLVTVLFVRDLIMGGQNYGFSIQIILWLWFTVLFANFAEAVAEGRGKAQAASLRATKTDIVAKKLANAKNHQRYEPSARDAIEARRCRFRRSGRPHSRPMAT